MAQTPIMVSDRTIKAITSLGKQLDVPPTAVLAHALAAGLCGAYGQLLDDDIRRSLSGVAAGLEGQYKNLFSAKQFRDSAALLVDSE